MAKPKIFQNAFQGLFGAKPKKSPVKTETDNSAANLSFMDDFVWVDEKNIEASQAEERAQVKTRLKDFALTETLAHSRVGAYGAPDREGNETLSIQDKDNGKHSAYRVIKIKTASTGLVGEVFVPVDPQKSQNIYVNWTGTYNFGTVLADLERAPGEESYRNEELDIVEQLNNVVKGFSTRTDKKANLVFTGHSLGGALAQQNWHSIQRAIATNIYENKLVEGDLKTCSKWVEAEMQYRRAIDSNEKHIGSELPKKGRSHLDPTHIQSITLGTWNSAGVLKATEDSSNQLAEIVNDAGVKQHAFFGMVGGDAVQRTGQGTVLSNVSDKEANVTLIKVDKGQEGFYQNMIFGVAAGTAVSAGCMLLGAPAAVLGGLTFGMLPMGKTTAQAHTSTHFNTQEFDKVKCQYYQNNTPQGRKVIHEKLTNKSTFLQLSPVKAMQKGLHYLLSHVIAKKKEPVATEMQGPEVRNAKTLKA